VIAEVSLYVVGDGKAKQHSVYVKLNDRKRSLSGKTTTTHCGISETATT